MLSVKIYEPLLRYYHMPIMAIDLQALDNSFLRPVVYDIIRQIKKRTRFPDTDKIFFLESSGDKPQQPGSAIGGDSAAPTGHDSALVIEVEEDYSDDQVLAQVMRSDTDPMVFLDPILGVNMLPIHTTTTIKLNVKARFGSKSQAAAWRNGIRRNTQNFRNQIAHAITYSYPIPKEMVLLLTHIYALRETNAGYGETMREYLKPRFAERVQVVVDQAGNNPTLVITETQSPVIGFFDFTAEPEKAEADADKGTWEISFSYIVYMQRPLSVFMRYPITVHNLDVNRKFINLEVHNPADDEIGNMSLLTEALSHFQYLKNTPRVASKKIRIPYYDDWAPKNILNHSVELARMLITVDKDNLTDLFNLNNLGSYTLHPLLLDYIREYPNGIVDQSTDLVKVNLYKWRERVTSDILVIDSALNITTNVNMNLRNTYHVVFTCLTDLTLLPNSVINRLIRRGEFFLAYVESIFVGIWKKIDKPMLLSDGSIGMLDFKAVVYAALYHYAPNVIRDINKVSPNVGSYFIIANRV